MSRFLFQEAWPEILSTRRLNIQWAKRRTFRNTAGADVSVDVLKNSSNKAIVAFGVYIQAFSARELSKVGKERTPIADNLYNRAITYFKSQMMQDSGNIESVVYRARLYAENGKFILADEMAKLLDEDTHKSLTEYILKCRKELKA